MRRQSTGPPSHATLGHRSQHKREREERKSGISISNEKVSISPQTRQSVRVITQETQGRVRHTGGGREETGKGGEEELMQRGRESGRLPLKETAAREKVRLPPLPLIQLEVFGRTRRKGHWQRQATAPPPHPAADTPKPNPLTLELSRYLANSV